MKTHGKKVEGLKRTQIKISNIRDQLNENFSSYVLSENIK